VAKSKFGGNCDARVDFGDGKGRTIEFGVATTRTLRYTYAKGGSYKVSVKGTGKAPCEGAKETRLRSRRPAEKKAEEKTRRRKRKRRTRSPPRRRRRKNLSSGQSRSPPTIPRICSRLEKML
jgi:hypothetical protein